MHSSKLFTLLRGLHPEEIHWFQKFLKSPFYNNASANTLTYRLFEYLKKYYPTLDSPKLTKEKIFQKLFPDQKFNIQKLRKVMYELAVLTEEFFVTMRLRKMEFQKKKILVEELGERNLYPQFEKRTKELIGELEKLPYRDTFFYKNIYELNFNYSNHQETNRQKLNMYIFKTATEHLDYFYLLQKQQLGFAIKSGEKLLKNKLKVNSLNKALAKLKQETVFRIYELINQALSKSNNDSIYNELEILFKNEIEKLGRRDKIITLRILLNYAGIQSNKGNAIFFTKMFSLYKFGLAEGLLIENKQITETTFTNIISVGIYEKEFDWVETFIDGYKKCLPSSVRDDATFLSLGLLFFHKKEFSKSVDLILNQPFSKPLHILKSKTTLLRNYFEQYLENDSYYELLIAQTQSFEKFLRRNDFISDTKKEGYLNFVLFTRKIANGIWHKKRDSELLEKIKNTKTVILKHWLLDKIKTR